jgi:hypothetical protein
VFDHTWRESAGGKLSLRDLRRVGRALVDYVRKVARNELVRTPVCFNDVPAMLEELSALGVQPLVNTSTTLSVDGVACWFAGVDDALEGQADLGQL